MIEDCARSEYGEGRVIPPGVGDHVAMRKIGMAGIGLLLLLGVLWLVVERRRDGAPLPVQERSGLLSETVPDAADGDAPLSPEAATGPHRRFRLIRGRVLNAATRGPVTEFDIGYGPVLRNDRECIDAAAHTMRPVSDPEGRFFIEDRGTGEDEATRSISVIVLAQGFRPAVRQVDPTSEMSELEILLNPAALVEGRVVNHAGDPVADAAIYCGRIYTREDSPPLTRTASDGTFQLDEIPGPVREAAGRVSHQIICAVHRDYSPGYVKVPLPIEGSVEVLVTLPEGGTLRGVVTVNGVPLPKARVIVSVGRYLGARMLRCATDDRGEFVLTHVPPGDAFVHVSHDEPSLGMAKYVSVEEGRETYVPFSFELTGALEGVVTLEGEPARVHVQLGVQTADGGWCADISGDSDDAGYYRFENVPLGQATVSIHAPGTDPVWFGTAEIRSGQVARCDIEIGPGGIVTATAKGGDRDNRVVLLMMPGVIPVDRFDIWEMETWEHFIACLHTGFGRTGVARFENVQPGTYTLMAFPLGLDESDPEALDRFRFSTLAVTVQEGRETRVEMPLPPSPEE